MSELTTKLIVTQTLAIYAFDNKYTTILACPRCVSNYIVQINETLYFQQYQPPEEHSVYQNEKNLSESQINAANLSSQKLELIFRERIEFFQPQKLEAKFVAHFDPNLRETF